MKRKIILTVILTGEEPQACELTLKSLEDQSIGKDNMQVIQVKNAVELRSALVAAEGEYISILEPGVELTSNAYADAVEVMGNENICVFPVKSEERSGHVSAMNTYIKKESEFRKLNISYQFIHSCYFAFVLRRSAIPINQIEGANIYPILWRMLYCILVNTAELPVVDTALCTIQSTRKISEFWGMMKEQMISQQFIQEFLQPLFQYFQETELVCEKHARYVLMYYLNMFERNFKSEEEEYYGRVCEVITQMMETVGTPELYVHHLNFTRSRKYCFLKNYTSVEFEDERTEEAYALICNIKRAPTAIQFVTLEKDRLIISGSTKMYGEYPFQIQVQVNSKRYDCRILPKEQRDVWFDNTIAYIRYFQAEIPLQAGTVHELRIVCLTDTQEVVKEMYYFHKFAPLDDRLFFSYRRNGWIFSYCKNADNTGYVRIEPQTAGKSLRYSLRTLKSLWKNGRSGKKAIVVRTMYHFLKKGKQKIWLISDRVDRGDDNGEVFFEYLMEHKPDDVDAYFVLEKKSADYDRIRQLGRTLEPFSWKHKLYHLLSDFVISSQGNFAVVNPFGRFGKNYKDIMSDGKFVFLQHGVTKDDVSSWLNLYNRNMYGFVVTTKQEYDSVFEYNYYYEPERIWLTGLPRYDRLYHDEKKYITIMPTWRKALAPSRDGRGVWQVADDFEESSYYRFYNGLLNHPELIRRAGELGYQICFMPHPNTVSALDKFVQHPSVKFFDLNTSYRKIFAETDLMLTDYSSVAFDFAYLRKPIIYSQFDHDEFFNGTHSYTEGYFDYVTDGFGEVEYTMEDTVNRIIEYMENGCVLKEMYRKRIEETFSFHDQECCRRVMERLMESR